MVVSGDLSQSMGPEYLGHPDHPDVKDLVEKTMNRIVAAGYATGSTANDSNIGRWVDAGGRMFLCTFQSYIQSGLKGLRDKAT